jgi:hypothetical protein
MASDDTERLIRTAFGSIWSLELLLVVRQRPDHAWSRPELIDALRASEQVVVRSTSDLIAVGLVTVEGGMVRYAPNDDALHRTVGDVAALYASRPAAVRRLIIGGGIDPVTRFADAFRFRKEEP